MDKQKAAAFLASLHASTQGTGALVREIHGHVIVSQHTDRKQKNSKGELVCDGWEHALYDAEGTPAGKQTYYLLSAALKDAKLANGANKVSQEKFDKDAQAEVQAILDTPAADVNISVKKDK